MVARKSLAFGLSMLLHLGFVCTLATMLFKPVAENRTIVVTLESWPLPARETGSTLPRPPSPPKTPAVSEVPKHPSTVKPRPIPSKVSRSVHESRPRPTYDSPQNMQAPPPPAAAQEESPFPGPTVGPPTSVTAGNPGTSRSRSYFALVLARIEAAKHYPPSAARRQMEGDVRVNFQLNPLGELLSDHLVKSSGFHSLDEAALEAIHLAAPYPRFPDKIEAMPESFTVTLSFMLRPPE
jgi:periplasmic protein TonB